MGKHHPCLLINPCLLTHVPGERRGNPSYFAQLRRKSYPAVLLGMLRKARDASGRADVYVPAKWASKSCLREASCISAVCFSFSKLYVHNDEADPEQSSSPDLPSLRFAVPSQVSRRLAPYRNLCS